MGTIKVEKASKNLNYNSSSLTHRILAEQLNLISQQIKIILIIVLFISSLAIWTLWSEVPHDLLLKWFFLVNFPSFLRLILFAAQQQYNIGLRQLGVYNIILAALSGTAWGAMA